jgi:hypothetical protein
MRTYAVKCPKGKLLMTQLSKRLVGIAASTVLLSLVSAAANAQTRNVLVLDREFENYNYDWVRTRYIFNSSMILNRIGFVASNDTNGTFKYTITGNRNDSFGYDDLRLDPVDINGIRWYTLPTPMTLIATDTVLVETFATQTDYLNGQGDTAMRVYRSENVDATVSVIGEEDQWNHSELLTNSNLRVSNPSSNVAPEPGTFALALSGGAALLGICIRLRRNAA